MEGKGAKGEGKKRPSAEAAAMAVAQAATRASDVAAAAAAAAAAYARATYAMRNELSNANPNKSKFWKLFKHPYARLWVAVEARGESFVCAHARAAVAPLARRHGGVCVRTGVAARLRSAATPPPRRRTAEPQTSRRVVRMGGLFFTCSPNTTSCE